MLRISEIFYSLQGEGPFQGLPTVFVRLTGCDLRCSWCDTEYAFQGGESLSLESLLDHLSKHTCRRVCVTGGEPLLQEECIPLLERLVLTGFSVSLETGGHRSLVAVPKSLTRVVDVKCPGSGECGSFHLPNLEELTSGDVLKFVVAGLDDFIWAENWVREHKPDESVDLHISPVCGVDVLAELAESVLQSTFEFRLVLQMHKQIWGQEAQGK